ncbi:hypothetical protein HXX76_002711 [Chlamydomonas incerta]|uniref:Uncharacterized protein n=1 Tax=Chlamydomonas incerta TaxID=51695 RepID=A0A835TP56_CHLIN|nr:hypothetical protein HXX76_002711 [Chlamydomonas incerta]|eukprot:KAG2442626.1 hypothetical protein HXX76_002711 [Chlamydomonas incerta]
MLLKRAPIVAAPRVARRAVVVKAQQNESANPVQKMALPLASMVAAALIAGAAMPEDALAASSRSGGRVGGSSGFAARKAPAPSRNIQTQAAPTVNNTTVVVASPPMFSPFGFSPFGGFGMGFGMPVFMPIGGGFFSGLIGLMFVTLLFSVVFNVIRGVASASSKAQNKKDDQWGDL